MNPTLNEPDATPTNGGPGTTPTEQPIAGVSAQTTLPANQNQNASTINASTGPDSHGPLVPNESQANEVSSVRFGRMIAWLPFSVFAISLVYLLYALMFAGAWRNLLIISTIPVSAMAIGLFFLARAFLRRRNWARLVAIFFYFGSLALAIAFGLMSLIGFIQYRTITNSMDPATVSLTEFQVANQRAEIYVYIMGGLTVVWMIVSVLMLIILFSKRTRQFFQPSQ